MYLRRIELAGFKSFAKKSALEFNAPVTAIVGPNGSGKSNIVEAVRFVLGEQSMKSLRGKTGSDLIFKGSKNLGKMARAGVSIIFDNSKKVFSLPNSTNQSIKLDFDEIAISREVYPDGANKYSINGSEVRLKDVHELVASVNIGSSGHHIISQGEADRILNASSKERRSMVEDALGLKVYQYRLKESVRKLDKTRLNIKEAQTLRREITPHISFLKKQVEKIEKAQELRQELETLSYSYLYTEDTHITETKHELTTKSAALHEELKTLDENLSHNPQSARVMNDGEVELVKKEDELRAILGLRDELGRKLGRIEGMIELEESRSHKPANSTTHAPVVFDRALFEDITRGITADLDVALLSTDLQAINSILERIREKIANLMPKTLEQAQMPQPDQSQMADLQAKAKDLSHELSAISEKEQELSNTIRDIKQSLVSSREEGRKLEQDRFELLMKKNALENEKGMLELKIEQLVAKETMLVEEVKELAALVGPSILGYKTQPSPVPSANQEELHRKIERIKIKLEDSGALGASDVMKEYQEASERDHFLAGQIDDLDKSMIDIETLIRDLKEKLDTEFKDGIVKINTQFQEFFSLMFGGGTAFLSVIVEKPRKKKGEEDDEEVLEEEEEKFENGIDINVSLPHKKVRELSMLSGGERSLTSIALLFAISQVNPPPFLVLDETDAALDEANSRKYGDMIETLARYSQLVVVTHNRETMSRASVLYGVTFGADGGSKLLSVKFEEATAFAK